MPVQWRYDVWGEWSSDWTDGAFSDKDEQALEGLFMRKTAAPVTVHVNMGGQRLAVTITSDKLDSMLFELPDAFGRLRREADGAELSFGVAYWDGAAYQNYDEQASTLVMDAVRFGRTVTTIYVGDGHPAKKVGYKVTTRPIPMQMRMDNSTERPVFIPKVAITTFRPNGWSSIPSKEAYDKAIEGLPDSLIDIVKCSMTLEVMRKPVVAADGHSYEERAIMKWLMKHDTSPITGAPLAHKNLIPNLHLRKLIDGLLDEEPDSEVAVTQSATESPSSLAGKAAMKRAMPPESDEAEENPTKKKKSAPQKK